ncbi:MAG TPA: c-type cytochrome [Phycisphaerales bacterium]|nr:c-type cytochrome [Phycisphaerales bacterium]
MTNAPAKITVCLCVSFAAVMTANVFATEKYLSPSALAIDTNASKIYIAETTARQIAVFDIATAKVQKHIPLPAEPTGLVLSRDREKLYVTTGLDFGSVQVVDIGRGKVVAKLPAGYAPLAPVLSAGGKKLYICNQFNNNVTVIDLASKKQVAAIPVNRQPVAAALTPDGKKLFVANLLPSGRADGDYNAAVISIIDAKNDKHITDVELPNGSIDIRGICISPDGKYAYATCILARYQLPTTQLERGWMNTNALIIIDARSNEFVNTVLLDDVDLGAANPWAIVCTACPDETGRSFIFITHAGTHELSIIDQTAMHKKLDDIAAGKKVSHVSSSPEDVPNDLSFLTGIRKRIKLEGNGPRALAIAGQKAYIAEYFSGSLGVVNICPEDTRTDVISIALGNEPEMTPQRKGEMFFNDATLCFQKWQSCATCHPDDVRPDAINWDLLNDGIGNPKQTKNLVLSHKTAPAMITGIRPDAETAVRAGLRFIQFAVRPEEDAAAIDEYLKSLEPAPSPKLVKRFFGKRALSRSAKKGSKLFTKAGCGDCHSGSLYTDLKTHDVGTGIGSDQGTAFDTPTLIEIWRTAPYLYDGRAATIKNVMTEFNANGRHGSVSNLTEKQLNDLAEFVLSL